MTTKPETRPAGLIGLIDTIFKSITIAKNKIKLNFKYEDPCGFVHHYIANTDESQSWFFEKMLGEKVKEVKTPKDKECSVLITFHGHDNSPIWFDCPSFNCVIEKPKTSLS